MKLRNKILSVITFIWLIFLALTYLGSKEFLIKSFLSLEQQRAEDDLDRVDRVVQQTNRALYGFASDWSHWNDAYAYLEGKNPQFVLNNLTMEAFVNASISFISIWDNDDHLLVGASMESGKLVPFPKGIEKYIYPGSIVFDQTDETKSLSGYILTDDGIMLIGAAAITDGEKLLPPLGTAVFARDMNKEFIKRVGEITKTDISLLLPNEIARDPNLKQIFNKQLPNTKHYKILISEDRLVGYTLIKDIFNQPIGMLKIINHRHVYLTGIQAVKYYLSLFLILAIVFSVLIWWLLKVLVIQRLEKLDNEIAIISKENDVTNRVSCDGNDELSSVSTEINHLLAIIQTSQDHLEQRVAERTTELQQMNVKLQEEITERKSIEKELTIHKEHLVRLAHYDHLTSLPNRVFFNEILNKVIQEFNRDQKHFAILFVDLDRFKVINDALGHTVGDLVLKEISARFATLIKSSDTLARLGGDEFIILLHDITEPHEADLLAGKILELAKRPIVADGHELFISASVGISIFPDDGLSMETLQKNADLAMYKSKHDGGGVSNFFIPAMNKVATDNMKMEAALRRAIVNGEFKLYFQPQLDLKEGKITRAEALIRWEDPELGLIKPDAFIPLAEDTGLIIPIGEWALHEACRINKSWIEHGYGPIVIAVNISPKQFRHQDIAQVVSDALSIHELDAQHLEIEVTESAVMEDVAAATIKLNRIKAMNVHISIDDFGTGYTSINYLRQYPVSVLKIDQTFIKGLPSNQHDAAITSAVIALGHNLGLLIVAEGVETEAQLQYLHDHDCDLIQGYYISRPLPEDKFVEEFLKKDFNFTLS